MGSEYDAFIAWLNEGLERKWVSTPVCAMHNGLPMTPDEENEVDTGWDPCLIAMRLWFT